MNKKEERKDISISAQKILNNEKLTKSDYKKVSEYFLIRTNNRGKKSS